MQDQFDIDQLVHYLAGECTEEQRAEIEAWIEDDEEHQRLVQNLEQVWTAAASSGSLGDWDVDALWERLHARMEDYEQGRRSTRPRKLSPAPAHEPRRRQSARARSPWSATIRVAGILILITAAIIGIQQLVVEQPDEPAQMTMREIATEPGQRGQVTLSDGSQVHLNVASKITMPAQFAAEARELYLQGEAYFDVEPDENRPFIVHAGEAVIQVLGTSFNVHSYDEDVPVVVVVAEGKVAVNTDADPASEGVLLTQGQMAAVQDHALQKSETVDLDYYLAWRDRRLLFVDAGFEEVKRKLERWYDLEIQLADSSMALGALNATFTDESMSEILNIVSLSLGLRHERQERHVIFYPAASAP